MSNSKHNLIFFTVVMFTIYLWSFLHTESCIRILAPAENRELGLIELSQTFFLIAIGKISYSQFNIAQIFKRAQDFLWFLFFCLMVFVLLEEIDYGLHYYDYLLGNDAYSTNIVNFRNIHNQGNNNRVFKGLFISILTLLFVVLPLLKLRIGRLVYSMHYAVFYLLHTVSTYVISLVLLDQLTILQQEIFHKSQIYNELRELSWYFILLSFIYEFKNELIIPLKITK